MKKIVTLIVIAGIAAGGWFGWKWYKGGNDKTEFRMVKVEKGDVVQTVNATGIVQPVNLIQVGTQVSGPVKKLYVDFNSPVVAGAIVAEIDPAVYKARVAQDRANLERSRAEVEQVQANLTRAEKDMKRLDDLAGSKMVSQSELDAALATRDALRAQIKIANASVEQCKSALDMSLVNESYTVIKSPVSGIVISRNVDEGQTVVANMSAQTLFMIATDIANIKVEANIPEADIGRIKMEQAARFTVDAYPENEFEGTVKQIRLSPMTVQNVVTYTVIIMAKNPGEKLLPGMTANLVFEVARAEGKLKVPNSALRFSPDESLIEGGAETAPAKGNGRGPKPGGKGVDRRKSSKVWIRAENGLLKSVVVTTGITDGAFTEIVSGELSDGQEMVIGVEDREKADKMANPLAPQMGHGGPGRK
jgi:HlyD family secretion protein